MDQDIFPELDEKHDNSTRVIMGTIGLAQSFDWEIACRYVEPFLSKMVKHTKEHRLEHGINASSLVPVRTYKGID
ncbi:hypothetical protein E6H27_03530 [Candidatus Bathyarchaeota archaeon]|nr:MAG: hypothetical protein E6H27_03530 [Candidatus Bathyarchaeota archaeon]TMI58872.1 MAG: hypothetical protein E6H14_04525 [Candidatus Bathyarchaeota archaeon]